MNLSLCLKKQQCVLTNKIAKHRMLNYLIINFLKIFSNLGVELPEALWLTKVVFTENILRCRVKVEIRTGFLSASYNQLLDKFFQLIVNYESFIHLFLIAVIGRRRLILKHWSTREMLQKGLELNSLKIEETAWIIGNKFNSF